MSADRADIASLKNILVATKFRFFGDTIVATAFLRHLRAANPNAKITLLTGPSSAEVLSSCPLVQEIWTLNSRDTKRIGTNLSLVRRIREAEFDGAFLLNRSLQSALVTSMAGVPLRIGHNTEHRSRWLTHSITYDWSKPDRECLLDLLREQGIVATGSLPQLWISREEIEQARTWLVGKGIAPHATLVGMKVGANDPSERKWQADRFAAVANWVVDSLGAKVVLLGTEAERKDAEEVAALASRDVHVLSGETDLRRALAIIARCRLWIGVDGGLQHAAVALCPASVGIYGPDKIARWGYFESSHRSVSSEPTSGIGRAARARTALDSISSDEVISHAQEVMQAIGAV
jgi:lipopolysaccharide heptosyltransferase II